MTTAYQCATCGDVTEDGACRCLTSPLPAAVFKWSTPIPRDGYPRPSHPAPDVCGAMGAPCDDASDEPALSVT